MNKGLVGLAASALLSVPNTLAAQTRQPPEPSSLPHASLVVTRGAGADGCPDAATLADQVQRVSGARVVQAGVSGAPPDTWIEVAIVRDFAGYRAELRAGGQHHGARTLEDLGPGCSSLADAVTVTIAIFLDPYANAGAPQPAPTPPRAPAVTRARAPTPQRRTPHFALELGGGAGFSLLQHTEPLLATHIAWRASERWSLVLGGSFVFPDSISEQSRSVDLGLSFALLLGCARSLGGAESAHVDWCAGPLLGSLWGKGVGYESSVTKRAGWSALGSGPEIVLPFTTSLAWSLSALAALPLTRSGFDVQNAGTVSNVFRSPAVAGLVSVGVRGEL